MTEQAEAVEIDRQPQETPAQQVAVARPKHAPIPTGGAIKAVIPRDVSEAGRLAVAIIKAGLCPDSYKDAGKPNESKVMIGILKSLEVGLPPITGLSTIAIINGKPSVYGDGLSALLQKSGALVKREIEEIGDRPAEGAQIGEWPDSYGVTVRLYRKGQDEPYEGEFTVGAAKRAKLWMNVKRDPWIKYPKRMMMWRAFGFAVRDGFSDCLSGLWLAEEVEDMGPSTPEAPDTSFLDDDATPEPLPAPEPEDEAAPAEIADVEAAEVAAEEEPPAPSARVARMGDDANAWKDWIQAMAAAIKAAESEAELSALLADPGNAADLIVLQASSQGNHHKLMQLAEGRQVELQSLDRTEEVEAEPELEPEPAE